MGGDAQDYLLDERGRIDKSNQLADEILQYF